MNIDIGEIKFDERGLVPAIAQEAATGEVLMLAYMNREALDKTLSTGRAHYWSRSRESLWLKGETSGHFQLVSAVYYDCDADTLLIKISQTGVACHTGARSCFFRRLDDGGPLKAGPEVVGSLFEVLKERKGADPATSYVASLYSKGRAGILEKVVEESGEFVEAAETGKRKEIVHEFADLLFHGLVLLGNEDIEVDELFEELSRRAGTSGLEEKASRKKKG